MYYIYKIQNRHLKLDCITGYYIIQNTLGDRGWGKKLVLGNVGEKIREQTNKKQGKNAQYILLYAIVIE